MESLIKFVYFRKPTVFLARRQITDHYWVDPSYSFWFLIIFEYWLVYSSVVHVIIIWLGLGPYDKCICSGTVCVVILFMITHKINDMLLSFIISVRDCLKEIGIKAWICIIYFLALKIVSLLKNFLSIYSNFLFVNDCFIFIYIFLNQLKFLRYINSTMKMNY